MLVKVSAEDKRTPIETDYMILSLVLVENQKELTHRVDRKQHVNKRATCNACQTNCQAKINQQTAKRTSGDVKQQYDVYGNRG